MKRRYIRQYNKNNNEQNKYRCKLISALLDKEILESKENYYNNLKLKLSVSKFNSKIFGY